MRLHAFFHKPKRLRLFLLELMESIFHIMKKFLLLFALLLPFFMKAETICVDGLYYEIVTDWDSDILTTHACLVSSPETKYSGDIIVPDSVEYNGSFYQVKALAARAFEDCGSLNSIKLPEGIITIGDYCFHLCYALNRINLPNSIISLGVCCFGFCKSLLSIDLPSEIKYLPDYCFYCCNNLEKINLPPCITSIGNYCFRECFSLKTTIPSTVTSLGEFCFSMCNSLDDFELPEGIATLGDYCFYHSKFKTISIPTS